MGIATMAIVWACGLSVQGYAAQGRDIRVPRGLCPRCRRELVFWSGYFRFVRDQRELRVFIHRGRCPECGCTHALLPSFLLRRRLDPVRVIGPGLALGVAGLGMAKVALKLGVPHSTARGWRRRHRARAPTLISGFAALGVLLGGEVTSWPEDPEQAALAALGAAWVLRRAQVGLWDFASLVSGGAFLGTNTTPPWASLGDRSFMAPMPSNPTQEAL